MVTSSRQPDPEPEPLGPRDSTHDSNSAPDAGRAPDTQKSRPQDSATGTAPLVEDRKDTGGNKHRLNAARIEVRLRRIALLGLVLVPLLYFIVQSLR
ncbi:hypothetical protein GCM10025781_18810 [Kocuria gwangalliensis]|uniref:Uncharacterized protein n=1 Tax=Kocuria gwangalliensis TaxID=501592 RepID=A0ABP8X561_9MICC